MKLLVIMSICWHPCFFVQTQATAGYLSLTSCGFEIRGGAGIPAWMQVFIWKVGRVENGVRVAKLLSLICLVCSRDGGQRLGQVQLDDSMVAYFLIARCLLPRWCKLGVGR